MTRTTGSVPLGRSSTRPVAPEFGLHGVDLGPERGGAVERGAVGHLHVVQDLRHRRHGVGGEFGHRPARARHDVEQVQSGENAVAGGRKVAQDDVARLLAAERVAALGQRLEHVAVAHVGLDHLDAVLGHGQAEPEVRHHGDHDGVAVKLSPGPPVERAHRHDLVAVHQRAGVVDGQHPVGITVEGETDIGAARPRPSAGVSRGASTRNRR